MRTYTTTATVQDGKLVVNLPDDFHENEHLRVSIMVEEVVSAEDLPPQTRENWDPERFARFLKSIAGTVAGPVTDGFDREAIYERLPGE